MALGVIPPLCASLSPVLAGPQGCSRGRWRSGPSKWRHTATLGGRGQGAPRTCRCIETRSGGMRRPRLGVREHHAPVGALRRTRQDDGVHDEIPVREHHAPVGALRHDSECQRQGLARVREHHAPVGALRLATIGERQARLPRQGAPRTCRCIETGRAPPFGSRQACQGAPRTCRCIETENRERRGSYSEGQGAPRTCRCIETHLRRPLRPV